MFTSKSIRQIFQRQSTLILIVAILPLIFNTFFYTKQLYMYQKVVENINAANEISSIVKDEIPVKMRDLAYGQTNANSPEAKNILINVRKDIQQIEKNTTTRHETSILEVTYRTLDTIQTYLDEMIHNLQTEEPVAKNETTLAQIDSVNQLLDDVLQDFVKVEIELASQKNEQIANSVTILLKVQAAIFIIILFFIGWTKYSLTKYVQQPIDTLVSMANNLSKGDLTYRVSSAEVAELNVLTSSMNRMAGELDRLITDNAEKQYHLAQSELRVLQAQITPHFIYNTLDAIIALTEQGDMQRVKQTIYALSDFFRISLSRGKDWISVEKEARHVSDYLTILKTRYGESLLPVINIPDTLYEYDVLKMILQPLVENAVYHGTKFVRRQGIVELTGYDDPDFLYFQIKDNGIGMSADKLSEVKAELAKGIDTDFEEGYGLYNVNKRILLYYGSSAHLSVESQYRQGTIMTIKVPKISKELIEGS
ncbi:histidine kinase [Vagococcus sp. BWB3-3]|uniref:histidine kinase n=1 Tax=Vagococcus allomyrinae TaxID=2794353 RepID=A0A940PH06_9ENTE|nr:histidine kinase [Vagococcus allomyrinae]MBP1042743.1 histidine kinase [Vagococcus allomyrinae]